MRELRWCVQGAALAYSGPSSSSHAAPGRLGELPRRSRPWSATPVFFHGRQIVVAAANRPARSTSRGSKARPSRSSSSGGSPSALRERSARRVLGPRPAPAGRLAVLDLQFRAGARSRVQRPVAGARPGVRDPRRDCSSSRRCPPAPTCAPSCWRPTAIWSAR